MEHWHQPEEMIVLSSDDEDDDERPLSQSQHTAPLSLSPAAPPERRAALPPAPVRPGQAAARSISRDPSVKQEDQMVELALVEAEEDELEQDYDGGFAGEEDEDDEEQDEEEEDELKPDASDSQDDEPLKPYEPRMDSLPVKLRGVKTVKELFRMVENGTIDLCPDYQRDVVWKKPLQQGLINSLLKNMHVPELLFNITVDEDVDFVEGENAESRKIWMVTDGKQRISSICAFMRGEISAKDDNNKIFFYRSPPGKPRAALSKAARADFDSLELRYVAYDSLTDEQERQLFQRVQLGKALSSDQKYKAVQGRYVTWVQSLVDQYCDPTSSTSFDSRIAEFNGGHRGNFTRVLLYLEQGVNRAKFASTTQIASKLASDELPSPERQARIFEIFDRFQRLSLTPQLVGNTDTFPATIAAKLLPGTPFPHQAFRPDGRVVSLVEFGWLPMIIDHWWDEADGALLEIIERFRSYLYFMKPHERYLNPTIFKLMLTWTQDLFDPSMLEHKYNDDGTLRQAPNYANLFIPSPTPAGSPAPEPAPVPAPAPVLGARPVVERGVSPPHTYGTQQSTSRRNTIILTPQPEAGPSGIRRGRSTASASSPTADEEDGAVASEAVDRDTVKRERAEDAEFFAAEEARAKRKKARRDGETEEEKQARKRARALRKREKAEKEQKERHMRIAHEVTQQAALLRAQQLVKQEQVAQNSFASLSHSLDPPSSSSRAETSAAEPSSFVQPQVQYGAPSPPALSSHLPPQVPRATITAGFGASMAPRWGGAAAPRDAAATATTTTTGPTGPPVTPAVQRVMSGGQQSTPQQAVVAPVVESPSSSLWGDAIYFD